MMRGNTDTARRLRRDQTDVRAHAVVSVCAIAGLLVGNSRRQVPIDRFIVDFCCADAKLIVELDGGQHDKQQGT